MLGRATRSVSSCALLLLDDIVCLKETHDKRRQRLWSVVCCIPCRAGIGTRQNIDFRSADAPDLLEQAFARATTQRWEGLLTRRSVNCVLVSFEKDAH